MLHASTMSMLCRKAAPNCTCARSAKAADMSEYAADAGGVYGVAQNGVQNNAGQTHFEQGQDQSYGAATTGGAEDPAYTPRADDQSASQSTIASHSYFYNLHRCLKVRNAVKSCSHREGGPAAERQIECLECREYRRVCRGARRETNERREPVGSIARTIGAC